MEENKKISVTPMGEEFTIPNQEEYQQEFEKMEKLAKQAKSEGKEVVVVMGLGFVGVVMAGIVADTVDENGQPSKYVIGCQRPSVRSYWKIPVINQWCFSSKS
jgi:UDP-N-acetyl-D-glucosamine dehydrogenase